MKVRLSLLVVGLLTTMCFGALNVNASEKETDFVVDIDPQAMLIIPDEPVVLSVVPSQNGTFDSASFDVFASTNSKHGYTLTLETNKTHLESTFVDADTGIASRISAMSFVDGGISKTDFMNSTDENVLNHWGISIDNETSFNPIGTSMVLKTTSNAANLDKTTINVATKINTEAEFGNYATTINFALTPNVIAIPQGVSGGDIGNSSGGEGGGYAANTLARSYEIYYQEVLQKSIYVRDNSTPEGYHLLQEGESTANKEVYFAMQDMNSTICNRATVIPDQLQVMDLRDAKVYWIAKLADGKCWMTQNLDLDLNTNVTLTPSDTDVKRNWTPSISTMNYDGVMTSSVGGWQAYSESKPYSLDMGDWYWIGNWEKDGTSTWYSSGYNYYNKGDVGNPVKFQFRIPFEGNGTHGHLGNYYTWTAAVAMDNQTYYSGASENLDTSICPAHWRLPHYGDYSHLDDNEYYQLAQKYGGSVDPITGSSSDRNLTAAPLYFVRAGEMNQSFYDPGNYGYYWTAYNDSSSYGGYMYFYSTGNPSWNSTTNKYYGMSVRCVAR